MLTRKLDLLISLKFKTQEKQIIKTENLKGFFPPHFTIDYKIIINCCFIISSSSGNIFPSKADFKLIKSWISQMDAELCFQH